MKIIYDLGKTAFNFKKVFLAIGVFDGVHRGHQVLIKNVVEKARKVKGTSVVMTFHPHPVQVLHPEIECPLLTSIESRLKCIEALGVDVCILIRFTKKFSQLVPEAFIKKYLVNKIKPKEVFVGGDFRFGQDRQGNVHLFQEEAERYGFKVHPISAVKGDKRIISSTRIRRLISGGQLYHAMCLLGRHVAVSGCVVHGEKRGKLLGFPTANIKLESGVLPPAGVYIVSVFWKDKHWPAMANIGWRPSFNSPGGPPTLEVYILDFKQNIYNEYVAVEFFKKIRNEKKFSSPPQLISQLKSDEKQTRRYFQNHSTI